MSGMMFSNFQPLLFLIRLMDEVKDFEKDKVVHPERWESVVREGHVICAPPP